MSVAPVREITAYSNTSSTTKTATFSEGTALDDTHLLVAVLNIASSTNATTPSGWTAITGGGANGSVQTRMYARRGNGSVNGVTITTPNITGGITLLAFKGYVSLTPLAAVGTSGSSASSVTVYTGNATGFGVAISAVGGGLGWGNWTGGARAGTLAHVNQRHDVAWSLYDDAGSNNVAHTISWGSAQTQRYMSVVFELASESNPTPAKAFSFNEGAGSTALDTITGTTAEANAWATGRTGNGVVNPSQDIGSFAAGPASSVTEWTFMAWGRVAAAAAPSSRQLLLVHDPDQFDNIIHVEVATDGILKLLLLVDGTWSIIDGVQLTVIDTNWHHFAIVRHGPALQLYIDGEPEAYIPSAYPTTTQNMSMMSFGVAANWNTSDAVYGDDSRIFDKVLTRTQIKTFSEQPVYLPGEQAPLPEPFAAYNFSETVGGLVEDLSGNGYHLTIAGDPLAPGGKNGQGAHISDGNYFTRSGFGSGLLSNWTFMTWYKPNGPLAQAYGQFIHDGSEFWAELTTDNRVGFSSPYVEPALTVGEWAHIAFTGSGANVAVYVNGVLSASRNNWAQAYFYRGSEYKIGMGPGGADGALNGVMDDVRVFSSTLTEAQINQYKDTPVQIPSTTPVPIAAYGFYETAGSATTADSTGNGNTLSLDGGVILGGGYLNSTDALSTGARRLTFTNPTVEATIMGWVTPNTDHLVMGEEALFGFWDSGADPGMSTHFGLWRNRTSFGQTNSLQGNVRVAGTLYDIGANRVLFSGEAHHVALTYGPAGAHIYVDGVSAGAYTWFSGDINGGGQFVVGADNPDTQFDDVRVFDKQLTQSQIAEYMYIPVAAPPSSGGSQQKIMWRGRSGGVTVTYVRAAVRIAGQTVPIVRGGIRVNSATVPLRLEAASPSPFDVLGSSSVGRTGSGSIVVPLPAGTGGSVLIFVSGNQLTEPSIPAGWTKVNWSTANAQVATGIYAHTSPSSAPTFNITQAQNGGIGAVAFRIRGTIGEISALGTTDSLVSPSTTSVAKSLVIRTIMMSLAESIETTLTFPPGTYHQQYKINTGLQAGSVVSGAVSGVIESASASGTATWGLNNVGTTRAATWLVEIT